MYIFNLVKKIFAKKEDDIYEFKYNPLNEAKNEETEGCCHEFMPVDSTGETLACIKCGFIVKHKKTSEVNRESNY